MHNQELLNYKVLYIEDEKELNEKISMHLKRYFKDVYAVFNALDGYEIYLDKKPHIIFLDINLPKMSGLEFVKKIRMNDHETKVVMMTARSDFEAILEATELKLTKYLIKPINRKDLQESIELLLYELTNFKILNEKNISLGHNIFWNINNKELTKFGQIIPLTPTESKILDFFFQNRKRVLSFDDIIIHIWNNFDEDKKESLKTIIKRLRKKLPETLIQNEYGVGYKVSR